VIGCKALPVAALSLLALALAGCSGAKLRPTGGSDGAGGAGGSKGPALPGDKSDAAVTPPTDGPGIGLGDGGSSPSCNPCDDFPATPIIDPGNGMPTGDAGVAMPVPSNASDLFGPADRGTMTGGPCLLEPEAGTLVPRNWFRPRVRFVPGPGQTVFEVRITTPRQKNPLVVYTGASTWTMPKAMWTALAAHAGDDPISIAVRGLDATAKGMPAKAEAAQLRVAPVDVGGSIVYWTTSAGSALKGFTIPEETVVDVMRPQQTQGRCIGCHSSTPDGLYVAFASSTDSNNGNPSHPELRAGKDPMMTPDFVTPSAQSLLARPEQQLPNFSKAHWSKGDRLMISMYQNQIMWTDLEATSAMMGMGFGFLTRTGDTLSAAYPTFSHDGTFVTYTSTSSKLSAGESKDGNIYRVPWNDRKGGDAKPVMGAATAEFNEYYPATSPDDRFIAFTRVPLDLDSHHNPKAENFVVPSDGGTAVRFKANDPPACSGKTSPGITNSWPKWAPVVNRAGGKTYYWLTFSSTREDGEVPQLYVTPLVVDDAGGNVTTYPAIYLWNQPAKENNHTPAWDIFDIRID
jgi:hypothetical protein